MKNSSQWQEFIIADNEWPKEKSRGDGFEITELELAESNSTCSPTEGKA